MPPRPFRLNSQKPLLGLLSLMRGPRVAGTSSSASDCLNGLYSFDVLLVISRFFLRWMSLGHDSFSTMTSVNGLVNMQCLK